MSVLQKGLLPSKAAAAAAPAKPAAGAARGVALSPPPYGIEFVDRAAVRPQRAGLPEQLKHGVESLSGLSLDHVTVHYDSQQPARFDAAAYAQGSDIHLAPGQRQHLPHEAWHVVQQLQGRVAATSQLQGVAVSDAAALEREADVMGARAASGASVQPPLAAAHGGARITHATAGHGDVLQCKIAVESVSVEESFPEHIQSQMKELNEALAVYLNVDDTPEAELVPLARVAARALALSELADLGNESDRVDDWLAAVDQIRRPATRELELLAMMLLSASPSKPRDPANSPREEVADLPALDGSETDPRVNDLLKMKFREAWDGMYPPSAVPGFDREVVYATSYAPAFDGDPKAQDVTQGSLGNCWLLGPLAAVANTPLGKLRLREIITLVKPSDRRLGSAAIYDVRFYDRHASDTLEPAKAAITVVSTFPMDEATGEFAYALSGTGGKKPLWPAIIEKAWAQAEGGYASLTGGGKPGALFEAILGIDSSTDGNELDEASCGLKKPDAQAKIKARVNAGQPVSLATYTHYVSVLAVDDAGLWLRDQGVHRSSGVPEFWVTWPELFKPVERFGLTYEFLYYVTTRAPAAAEPAHVVEVEASDLGDLADLLADFP